MARNGLVASMGCRSSGRSVSQTISGAGVLGLADGPLANLSRRIHVRTSLTLATMVSLDLDDSS
jgi:hypothetical protein